MKKKFSMLKNFLDHSQDGFMLIDPTGTIIYFNPVLENISEMAAETILGKCIKDIKKFLNFNIDPKYNFDLAIDNLPDFFQTGEIKFLKGLIEIDLKTSSGICKKLAFFAFPLKIDDNYSLALSLKDITDYSNLLKEKEALVKSLKETNATKNKFLSIIAHDIKNPLNSIIRFSELMMEEDCSTIDLVEHAKIFNKSSKNLLDLLNNLLTWTKSQTEGIVLNPEFFDVSFLINNQLSTINPIVKTKDINIEFLEGKEKHIVFADLDMINIVVRNLIGNAVKFTKSKGKIKISLKSEKNFITICIQDNGMGIPDYIITKLFKIGESHIGRTGTNGEVSSGLGLILSKEFVEKNGGKIWVESPGDNQGSSFYFTLPRLLLQ